MVNADGVVRATGTGSTYVVATLADRPDARDSASIRVHPPLASGDPCPASRPTFGVATEADRALFAHDADAPLNLSIFVLASLDPREQIQLIRDPQRAVDVLIETGTVDPKRIAIEGCGGGGVPVHE